MHERLQRREQGPVESKTARRSATSVWVTVHHTDETLQLREERKADLERHVHEVNTLLREQARLEGIDGTDEVYEVVDEWEGNGEPPEVDLEAEYIDEDRYTTVTVEALDVSKEGLYKATKDEEQSGSMPEQEEEGKTQNTERNNTRADGKRRWMKEKPKDKVDRPKTKRKKFRYESKAERRVTRIKESSKNSKQAKARRST